VNETFVKRFFDHDNPLGRHIGWGGQSSVLDIEIIGVVADQKSENLRDKPRPFTFTSTLQNQAPSAVTFYVRTSRDPIALAQGVPQTMARIDAALPVFEMKTVETQIQETQFLDRLFAWLSGAFGILATLLASVGLYGVTAFAVTRRTQEIGIRIALGATRPNVMNMILREVLVLTAFGLAVGIPAALMLGRFIESQLYGMKARDPLVLAGAILTIVAVSTLAGCLPARRASRIDPMQALRYE
jgi:ABC-type antimicrobial peptide transport system permease subunit